MDDDKDHRVYIGSKPIGQNTRKCDKRNKRAIIAHGMTNKV